VPDQLRSPVKSRENFSFKNHYQKITVNKKYKIH